MPGSEDAVELAVIGDMFGPGSLMIMDHREQLPFLDLFPQIHFHLLQSIRFTSYVTSLVRHVQVDAGTQFRRSLEDTCMDQKITDAAFCDADGFGGCGSLSTQLGGDDSDYWEQGETLIISSNGFGFCSEDCTVTVEVYSHGNLIASTTVFLT